MLSFELLRRGCDVAIGKIDNREVDLSQLRWMIKNTSDRIEILTSSGDGL